MERFITPGEFFFFAIIFLVFSKSKYLSQKIFKDDAEIYANKRSKIFRICGYILFGCSLFWLVDDFFITK